MPRYQVIAEFEDKMTGARRQPGEVVEAEGDRVTALRQAGVISAESTTAPAPTQTTPAPPAQAATQGAKETDKESEIRHVGGGFWELPDGRKFRGREAALAALNNGQ